VGLIQERRFRMSERPIEDTIRERWIPESEEQSVIDLHRLADECATLRAELAKAKAHAQELGWGRVTDEERIAELEAEKQAAVAAWRKSYDDAQSSYEREAKRADDAEAGANENREECNELEKSHKAMLLKLSNALKRADAAEKLYHRAESEIDVRQAWYDSERDRTAALAAALEEVADDRNDGVRKEDIAREALAGSGVRVVCLGWCYTVTFTGDAKADAAESKVLELGNLAAEAHEHSAELAAAMTEAVGLMEDSVSCRILTSALAGSGVRVVAGWWTTNNPRFSTGLGHNSGPDGTDYPAVPAYVVVLDEACPECDGDRWLHSADDKWSCPKCNTPPATVTFDLTKGPDYRAEAMAWRAWHDYEAGEAGTIHGLSQDRINARTANERAEGGER
jgi:hypothetical protein